MKLDEVAVTPGAPAPTKKPAELEITGKKIEFSQTPQTDAEGQAAKITYATRAGAGMGQVNRGELGSIPAVIQYDTTAGELADGARTACQACRHWDQTTWLKMVRDADSPLASKEDKWTITQARTRLFKAYGADYEAALMQFGICKVMSEIIHGWVKKDPLHWPAATSADANCPEYVSAGMSPLGIPNRVTIKTPANPFGLFKPKDLDAIKIGNQRRDGVLFDADRKIR